MTWRPFYTDAYLYWHSSLLALVVLGLVTQDAG